MKIQIITTGKPDKLYSELIQKYLRLSSFFAKIELTSLQDNKNYLENLKKAISGSYSFFLKESGKLYTSVEFAKTLEKKSISSGKISFVISRAEGFSEKELELADEILSLSPLTMQHDLALLALLEQIYRSLSIINNTPYHKA